MNDLPLHTGAQRQRSRLPAAQNFFQQLAGFDDFVHCYIHKRSPQALAEQTSGAGQGRHADDRERATKSEINWTKPASSRYTRLVISRV